MTIYKTRKLDELGRIVLPQAMRNALGLCSGDTIEITMENNNTITLARALPRCALCGGDHSLTRIRKNYICGACVQEVKKLV